MPELQVICSHCNTSHLMFIASGPRDLPTKSKVYYKGFDRKKNLCRSCTARRKRAQSRNEPFYYSITLHKWQKQSAFS